MEEINKLFLCILSQNYYNISWVVITWVGLLQLLSALLYCNSYMYNLIVMKMQNMFAEIFFLLSIIFLFVISSIF